MGVAVEVETPNSRQVDETRRLYDRDFYTWALQQADALRRRDFGAVDWENIVEEVEDLGRRHADSLGSQYARIIEHLLKLEYRRPGETRPLAGWQISVDNARFEIKKLLRNNPGLKSNRDEIFAHAWDDARGVAIAAFVGVGIEKILEPVERRREQRRLTREWDRMLPKECPYTREQVEDPFWIPEWSATAHPRQK